MHEGKGGGGGSSWGSVLHLLKDRGLLHYQWKENPDYRPHIPAAQDMTSIPRYKVFYLPKDVALQYLSLCAGRLAQLGKRDVVTDQRQFADTLFDSDEQLRGQVATAVLEAYVPKDLATIDPARIAECRAQLSAERLKFQAGVQALVREFADAASVGTYETLKVQLVEIANERIDQTRRTYRKARLDVTVQTLRAC